MTTQADWRQHPTERRRLARLPRERGSGGSPRWRQRYAAVVVLSDTIAAAVAASVALLVRFGANEASLSTPGPDLPYASVAVILAASWLLSLVLSGAYDGRELGTGSEEYRRVFNGGVRALAALAIVTFLFRVDVARLYVAIDLPLMTALAVVFRHAVRKRVHRRREVGEMVNKVLVVGSVEHSTELIRHLCRSPHAGYRVFAACVPGRAEILDVDAIKVPILGSPDRAPDLVFETEADAVAVAGHTSLGDGFLRRLGWRLEGTGIDLIVAPALTDVAGPRIVTRPVEGLPLLHVSDPELSGPARLFKDVFDRTVAALLIVLGLPLWLVVAAAIRLTSHGSALFRQRRVGRDGRIFTVWKFRTMRVSAEDELTELVEQNEADGLLFKIRSDPRRTGLGMWLRRFSVDELPQLWNVVRGEMSIVGPRPPLPSEVEQYSDHTRRRLLVKPGMTGLWQVSGRADLAWDEAVRLDVYYVENWSPALDALILWRTVWAVLSGRGAY